MLNLLLLLIAVLLVACGGQSGDVNEEGDEAPAEPVTTTPPDVAGTWEGFIDVPGAQLDIIVRFFGAGDALTGVIDIPQQGAADLELVDISQTGDAIHFVIGMANAAFDGTVSDVSITGDFTQGPARGTFTLSRTGDADAPTPTPVPPYPVEDLTWDLDGTTMAGTLTLPEGDGPFPAVVFIAGSGPTDRDWNSPLLPGTNGSAKLLADALTRAGYATIRFDKRASGPNAAANMEQLAGRLSFDTHLAEVASAVEQLVARPEVDPDRLYVVANSEGTLHAMNYQRSNPQHPFAGLALLAPPGRPMRDVLLDQTETNVLAGDPNAANLLSEFEAALDAFAAGEDVEINPTWPEGLQFTLGGFLAPGNLPFTRELISVDGADWLSEMTAPVLVLIGQKDIQVDWESDGAALEAAAGDNVTFVYPPNANHIMKLEEKPAAELTASDAVSYNAADRVLDPEALQALLDWLAGVDAE